MKRIQDMCKECFEEMTKHGYEHGYKDGYKNGYDECAKKYDVSGFIKTLELFSCIEAKNGTDMDALMDTIAYKKFIEKLKRNDNLFSKFKDITEEIERTAKESDIDLDKMFEKYGKDDQ